MNTSDKYLTLLKGAIDAEKSGDLVKAETLYEEALSLEQNYDALIGSAQVLRKIGNPEKASQRLKAAFNLKPSINLRLQLIVSLFDSGNLDHAAKYTKEGLAKKPKEFSLLNVYGVILKQQGRYEEAIEYLNKAAKLNPKSVLPPVNLGNTYMLIDQPRMAAKYFLQATKLEPKNGEYYRLLATAQNTIGEYDKALSTLQQALSLSPDNYNIWLDICSTYYNMREYEKAFDEIAKSLTYFPNNPNFMRLKALILTKLGQLEQSLLIYEELLRKDPNDVKILTELGNLYSRGFFNLERANEFYALALSIDSENIEAAIRYGDSLFNSRYGNEAEHIEKAYEIAQSLLDKASRSLKIADTAYGIFLRNVDYENLRRLGERKKLFQYWLNEMKVGQLHNQLGRVETMEDRLDLLRAHREWGKKIEDLANKKPLETVPLIRTRNKTRIGIMSSDLRNHPVTYFAQPIFEHYDRDKFEVYCYSFNLSQPDAVQQRLTQIVDKFTVNPNLSDREIAKQIAADELDILFELGGTTHMNKVEVLSYQPAPVQVSWLGYPHSCGISTIDYILTDPYITPDQPELLIEQPFIMPETWVSLGRLGFYDIPIEPGIPENRQGYLTFGTMNNPYKYTAKMFETWAKIMLQVEGSHFLFVRPEGAVKYFCQNVIKHFASHGITEDRIEFIAIRGKHMTHYNRIDIALDSFPHTGGTTTCESLWMGVPVITLVGPAFFERLSYSNLNNAGLGELCTFSIDEYINKAVALAQNKEWRETLRHGLRQQILEHPLGQNTRFVRNFEDTIMQVLSSGKKRA
jgi:predicted O-linked N-acetylglucosamine transferase (SPINDLY family)